MHKPLRYLPALEYPLTRPFSSPWLSVVAFAVGFISCVLLCVANVALVGYEPTTEFQSNFNATQSFWYDKFMPYKQQKPGTLCDAHVFNIGESLVTNTSLFEWKVEAVYRPNAGDSGFSYRGETLENCDIVQIAFNGDVRTWSLEGNMYLHCSTPENYGDDNKLELAAVATFGVSGLTAKQTNFQKMTKSIAQDTVAATISNLISLAGIDVGTRVWEAYLASANTGVVAYSVLANFEFCPPALAFPKDGSPPHPCGLSPPQLNNITSVTMILANNTLVPSTALVVTPDDSPPPEYPLDSTFYTPTANFVHVARAAARIDLGNTATNNFLTNVEHTDSVLKSEFPRTPLTAASPSQLYDAWKSQMNPVTRQPYVKLTVPGPSTLQAVFICHFVKLKSTGSLIVSVLVATLSMFSSAWGLMLFIATYFLATGGQAQNCRGHFEDRDDYSIEKGRGIEGSPATQVHGLPVTPVADAKNSQPLLYHRT